MKVRTLKAVVALAVLAGTSFVALPLVASEEVQPTPTPAPKVQSPRLPAPPAQLDEHHNFRLPPPQPPDGKWLKDEQGREYFVEKFEKPPEGAYVRLAPNRVKLKFGTILILDSEDDKFFYGRIYRTDHIEAGKRFASPPPEPTAEELAAVAATYGFSWPESDRLRFVATAPNLPKEGQWRNGFAIADVNRDGRLDLIHGTPRGLPGHPPFIFLGDGKGGFAFWEKARFPQAPYDYGDVAVSDFNGDGHMDIACGVHVRGLLVLLGDSKGNFRLDLQGLPFETGELLPGTSQTFTSRAVVALDWPGNGRSDLLALAEGPMGSFGAKGTSRVQQSFGVRIYRRSDEGVWRELPAGSTPHRLFGDALAVADLDGDGKTDFVSGTNAQSVNELLFFGSQGERSWENAPLPGLRPKAYVKALATSDFDRDGRVDLAVAYNNWELGIWRMGIDLFLTRAERSFERVTLYSEEGSSAVTALAAGDADGDGMSDLFAGTIDGRILALLGDGKGGFFLEASSELEAEKGCQVYHLGLADLNGDRRSDLVASYANEECPGQGRLSAWLTKPRS